MTWARRQDGAGRGARRSRAVRAMLGVLCLGLVGGSVSRAAAQDADVPDNPFAEEGEGAPPSQDEAAPEAEAPEAEDEAAAAPAEGEGGDEEAAPSPFAELDPLARELAEVMDEIVQLRSTVEVLGRQLFATRLRVMARREGDEVDLEELVVELDGAPVFRGDGTKVGDGEPVELFEGFAAPGPHRLTLRYRMRARADDSYRYERAETYRFVVPREALTEVVVELEDDSDVAEDFADDGDGEFDVRTRLHVERLELEDAER